MSKRHTNSPVSVSRPDSDRTEIAFGSEGIAGSTPLRADCGVVVHVDNFDPGRLVRLTITHDEDELWPIETREFIDHITGVEAEDSFNFAKAAPKESPALPQSVSLLALTKNQARWLSPVYGLNALQIQSLHPDLFDIGDQLIDHGLRELRNLERRTANMTLREIDTRVQAYRDGDSGITKADLLESIAGMGLGPSRGHDFIPPYPPPFGRQPLESDWAIEILEYDIDHQFIDRAWWTVDPTGTELTIHASSQFSDVRVYAEIHEKILGSRRVERFDLSLRESSDNEAFRYTGRAIRQEAGETRISIHASAAGEESTRLQRMNDFSSRTMSAVAAKLHALGPDIPLHSLKRSDPSLRYAVEMVESLSRWASGETRRAEQCAQLLSADRTGDIAGFTFISNYPTLAESVMELLSPHEESAWSLIHVLDGVGRTEGAKPNLASRLEFRPGDSALHLRTESAPPLSFMAASKSDSRSRNPAEWWSASERLPQSDPGYSALRWLRFLSDLNKIEPPRSDMTPESEIVGSKSTTGMRSSRTTESRSPDLPLLWRLRIGQLGL